MWLYTIGNWMRISDGAVRKASWRRGQEKERRGEGLSAGMLNQAS